MIRGFGQADKRFFIIKPINATSGNLSRSWLAPCRRLPYTSMNAMMRILHTPRPSGHP
jgi:hypothetical protein